MSCLEASNEKTSENRLQLKNKNIKNDIFKNPKYTKIIPTSHKNQKL